MKKIILLLLTILIIPICCTGCVFDNITEIIHNNEVLGEIIQKHTVIWTEENNIATDDEQDFSIDININDYAYASISFTIENYFGCTTPQGVVIVDNNNQQVAFITLSEKINKKLHKNKIEEITNYSIDAEGFFNRGTWNCHKVFINDTANTKLFIFECVRNGSERAIEISGTDINELEKVISSINVYDEFYVVPNAVSDEAGIMFELFQ